MFVEKPTVKLVFFWDYVTSFDHLLNYTLLNLLYYLSLHTVRLCGIFVVLLMPETRKIQQQALRTVYSDNILTYEELLQRAKLPSTLLMWQVKVIAIIMYKVKNELVPPCIADFFVITSSQYHLRNSDFAIPRFHTVDWLHMANRAWLIQALSFGSNSTNLQYLIVLIIRHFEKVHWNG